MLAFILFLTLNRYIISLFIVLGQDLNLVLSCFTLLLTLVIISHLYYGQYPRKREERRKLNPLFPFFRFSDIFKIVSPKLLPLGGTASAIIESSFYVATIPLFSHASVHYYGTVVVKQSVITLAPSDPPPPLSILRTSRHNVFIPERNDHGRPPRVCGANVYHRLEGTA